MKLEPGISIILCTRDRATNLADTLQSLMHVTVPDGWTVELLLVDNGSTDETANVMRGFNHPRIRRRIVLEPKPGLSNARNRGVLEAEGTVLLFTDDDVRFPSGWIKAMCWPILSGRADAVAGGVVLADHLKRPWMGRMHRGWLAATEGINREAPQRMVGANMALGKHVFDSIPEFDPNLGAGALGSGEETLFSLQLREAGYTIASALDVAVEHHFGASRLTREAQVSAAEKLGRSEAYISFHWEHKSWPSVTLYGALAWWYIKISVYRLTRGNLPEEGASERELRLIRRQTWIRQMISEQSKSRFYPPRGLNRLHPLQKSQKFTDI